MKWFKKAPAPATPKAPEPRYLVEARFTREDESTYWEVCHTGPDMAAYAALSDAHKRMGHLARRWRGRAYRISDIYTGQVVALRMEPMEWTYHA